MGESKKIVSGVQRDERGSELLVHRFFDARSNAILGSVDLQNKPSYDFDRNWSKFVF